MIQIESIWDVISIIVFLGPIMSLKELINGKKMLLIGVLMSVIIAQGIKELTKNLNPKIFRRPDLAKNCDSLNSGGIVNTEPGFPSGHMTLFSFILNILYFRQENRDYKTFFRYNIWVVFMALARYMKNCHNIIQIIGGYLLGLGISYFIYKLKIKYSSEKS